MGILICGMNGTGKSTLGRVLARHLNFEFINDEDLFFAKEDAAYPFANPRSREEAVRILEERIARNNRFVFAAVRGDYGDKLIAALDCAALLEAPKAIRMQRVRQRSYQKFGDRILAGGDLFERENAWLSLADSRPEDYAAKGLESMRYPVLRVDGTLPIEKNVEILVRFLEARDR